MSPRKPIAVAPNSKVIRLTSPLGHDYRPGSRTSTHKRTRMYLYLTQRTHRSPPTSTVPLSTCYLYRCVFVMRGENRHITTTPCSLTCHDRHVSPQQETVGCMSSPQLAIYHDGCHKESGRSVRIFRNRQVASQTPSTYAHQIAIRAFSLMSSLTHLSQWRVQLPDAPRSSRARWQHPRTARPHAGEPHSPATQH